MPTILLVTVLVLVGSVGQRNAYVNCDGLLSFVNEDGSGADQPMKTDSRGAAIMGVIAASYDCHVWKDGYTLWSGVLVVDKEHTRFSVQLKKIAGAGDIDSTSKKSTSARSPGR